MTPAGVIGEAANEGCRHRRQQDGFTLQFAARAHNWSTLPILGGIEKDGFVSGVGRQDRLDHCVSTDQRH